MNKILVSLFLGLFLVSGVFAYNVTYSEPTNKDGSNIEWDKSTKEDTSKKLVSKDEWNKIFSDYRNGVISKEQASSKIKEVEVKW